MIEFARRKQGSGEGHLRIKNWTPYHTSVVMDSIQGMTHTELADKYNKSETYIGHIISSRQGKLIRANVDATVFAERYATLPELRKQGIIKAQQRIIDFLGDDELHNRAPLLCIPLDIKAFDSLVSADKQLIQAGGNVTINNQTNVIGNNVKIDALLEGLKKSDLVAEMHKAVTGQSIDKLEEVKVTLVK